MRTVQNSKKKKNKSKRHAGRVTVKLCKNPARSYEDKPCLFTSTIKRGDQPEITICSWCHKQK